MSSTGLSSWLGKNVNYNEAWRVQNQLARSIFDGNSSNTLLFLEHSPVYTVGRRFLENHLLKALGAPLVHTDRGGQVTYHGPGQLVCYPLILLSDTGLGPKSFVSVLEFCLIDVMQYLGIKAWTEEGLTGIWTVRGKVAAVGIKITKGVTTHGFALNINPDLIAFDSIIPCGIRGRDVTSLFALTGKVFDTENIRNLLTSALSFRLGIVWSERFVCSLDDLLK